VSPERPDQEDFLEDEEQEEYGQRSIFATGWFRAVLVLLVLAVIAVIAIPLIGGWFEPTPPPRTATKPAEAPSTPAPPPSATTPPASVPSQMPSPGPSTATAPPASTPSPAPTSPPPPAGPPPAAMPPAVRLEMPPPAPSAPKAAEPKAAEPKAAQPKAAEPKAAEKPKPPERVAAATPGKNAMKPAAAGGSYWVQVGAFKESRNAEGLARKLRAEGFPVQVSQVTRDAPLHVVRVGGYPNRSRATAAREELQGKGQTGFVTSGPPK
jgi:cell division protein FtsN